MNTEIFLPLYIDDFTSVNIFWMGSFAVFITFLIVSYVLWQEREKSSEKKSDEETLFARFIIVIIKKEKITDKDLKDFILDNYEELRVKFSIEEGKHLPLYNRSKVVGHVEKELKLKNKIKTAI